MGSSDLGSIERWQLPRCFGFRCHAPSIGVGIIPFVFSSTVYLQPSCSAIYMASWLLPSLALSVHMYIAFVVLDMQQCRSRSASLDPWLGLSEHNNLNNKKVYKLAFDCIWLIEIPIVENSFLWRNCINKTNHKTCTESIRLIFLKWLYSRAQCNHTLFNTFVTTSILFPPKCNYSTRVHVELVLMFTSVGTDVNIGFIRTGRDAWTRVQVHVLQRTGDPIPRQELLEFGPLFHNSRSFVWEYISG